MANIKKILPLFLAVMMIVSIFASCAKKEELPKDEGPSADEINSMYEDMINEQTEGLLPEGYNPITDSFTTVDFQFTKTDDTTAFNLPENSFATITPTRANFSFLDSSLPKDSFEGSFKTAKGMSLENTVAQILASYKLEDSDILALTSGDVYKQYQSSEEAVSVSFGFSSEDSLSFSKLSDDELLKVLLTRGAKAGLQSDANIKKILGDHQTVAIVDIVPAAEGMAKEITITRFDKMKEQ